MYNRIHNDHDTNVVRVELNSSYRPQHQSIARNTRASSREPTKITSSPSKAINRHDTFTKHDNDSRPLHHSAGIIRSETFIVKHHSRDDLRDQQAFDYSTFTKSKKKFDGDKNDHGDNFYDTYTRRSSSNRSEMRGSMEDDKSLYINTNTYRKMDKKRASLLSQESENLNANTFTKSSKPKRVESFIKKIEKNLWRRKETKKEPSPAPSSHSSDQGTIKRSKNIFSLISGGGRKSTREVEIQCKMDDERDYYGGVSTKKSSKGDEKKYTVTRPLKVSQQRNYENGSNQRLTSIMKSSQQQPDHRLREYESNNNKKSSTPAPIRIEIDLRNTNKRPIGVASPLPQKTRSALKNGIKSGNFDSSGVGNKKPIEITRSYAPSRLQVNNADNGNYLKRDGNERVSFREYREQLRAAKHENRQKINDTSDDELKRSYQQSFFVPM